jgi:hypothetical protein
MFITSQPTKDGTYDEFTANAILYLSVSGSMLGSFLLLYAILTLYGTFLLYEDVEDTGCDLATRRERMFLVPYWVSPLPHKVSARLEILSSRWLLPVSRPMKPFKRSTESLVLRRK